MAKNNDNVQNNALKRAMRIAEIRVEDAEDMQACVSDLVRTSSLGLNVDTARIVASAYREAMMPAALEAEGINPDEFIEQPFGSQMTAANFADDTDAEEMKDEHDDEDSDDSEDHADHEDDLGMEDGGEENDNVATLEVEVPADKVDEFQEALEKAMTEVFGDAGEVAEDKEDMSSDIKKYEEDVEDVMSSVTANRKVQTMSKNARAQREAILASLNTRVASDMEFKGSYENEGEYAKMTMTNSEGNSLRDQNPEFNKVNVPTLNGENLGFDKEFVATKLEGQIDDVNAYKVNFDPMSYATAEGNSLPEFEDFEVPTQTDMTSRNNTVTASDLTAEEAAEEELYNSLVQAGVSNDTISNLTFAEGLELYKQITASKVNELARYAGEVNINVAEEEEQASYGMMTDEENEDEYDEASMDMEAKWATFAKESEVFRARLKTAYGVSTKLCLAGLLDQDEVESNVDLWMNDGLTVKAMLASGAQMLRMSQTAEQRVASAHAEKSVRTASANGVATMPGYSGTTSNVSTDLQQALKSIFTMPRLDD
jgi:hypothetical protein